MIRIVKFSLKKFSVYFAYEIYGLRFNGRLERISELSGIIYYQGYIGIIRKLKTRKNIRCTRLKCQFFIARAIKLKEFLVEFTSYNTNKKR